LDVSVWTVLDATWKPDSGGLYCNDWGITRLQATVTLAWLTLIVPICFCITRTSHVTRRTTSIVLNNSAEDIYTDEFKAFLPRKRVYLVMGFFAALACGGSLLLFSFVFGGRDAGGSNIPFLVMGSVFAMVSAALIWLALQYLRDVRTGRTRRMEITVHHIGVLSKYGRPMQYTRPDRTPMQHTNIPAEYNWPLESVQLPQRARMWNTYYGGRLRVLSLKKVTKPSLSCRTSFLSANA